jgi:hypothetical protein
MLFEEIWNRINWGKACEIKKREPFFGPSARFRGKRDLGVKPKSLLRIGMVPKGGLDRG